MIGFFAMISRMKYINRWGLMRNVRNENICEHSNETAVIAHALALIKNNYFGGDLNPERVAVLAMYHDASEIITGDLPTPVKYHSPVIREAYKDVERLAVNKLTSMLDENLEKDYEEILNFSGERDKEYKGIIKAADKISAIIKCIEEKKSGNSDFLSAEITLREAVKEMDLPEVNMFMEKYLPCYELNLDELK